jgi:hypothetical protein
MKNKKNVFLANKHFDMSIESRKISFVQEFLKLQNEEIIEYFEKVMKSSKLANFPNELEPMSFETFNLEIEQSLEDSENGKLITAEALRDKVLQWS